jgi:Ca2+-binding EF-hand superfamily protein
MIDDNQEKIEIAVNMLKYSCRYSNSDLELNYQIFAIHESFTMQMKELGYLMKQLVLQKADINKLMQQITVKRKELMEFHIFLDNYAIHLYQKYVRSITMNNMKCF